MFCWMDLKTLVCVFCMTFAITSVADDSQQMVPPSGDALGASIEHLKNLTDAETFFKVGEYANSEEVINRIDPAEKFSDADLSRFLLLHARLEMVFGRTDNARIWFEKLVQHNPKLRLDPVIDPPEAIAIWEDLAAQERFMKRERKANAQAESASPTPSPEAATKQGSTFWVGLMPFGIGHFDAGRPVAGSAFLSGEALSLYVSPLFAGGETLSPKYTENRRNERMHVRMSELTFLGLWGYEVLDMLPHLEEADARRVPSVRKALSFAPFGAAQFKNNQPKKGWTFGVIETALVGYCVSSAKPQQRRIAANVLAGTMLYGAYDGWVNNPSSIQSSSQEKNISSVTFSPIWMDNHLGVSAVARFEF